jgi:hypothetical protein
MSRRYKAAVAVIGCLTTCLVLLILATMRIDPSPLRVGSTADEAWAYIHTNPAVLAPPKNSPLVTTRNNWRADALSIRRETRFYWRTNYQFATCKITYVVGTNSIITSVSSQWKFGAPAGAPPATTAPAPPWCVCVLFRSTATSSIRTSVCKCLWLTNRRPLLFYL